MFSNDFQFAFDIIKIFDVNGMEISFYCSMRVMAESKLGNFYVWRYSLMERQFVLDESVQSTIGFA